MNDDSVHRGQVGQPRPEPVSRTAPPVTTSTTLATRVAHASGRSHRAKADGHSHLNVRDVRYPPTTAHASRHSSEAHAIEPSMNAARIASPSAPDGNHCAKEPNAPYDVLGSTTAPPASSSR